MKTLTSLMLFVLLTSAAYSQYFPETVQQKTFEKSKYFFTSNYLNPFALDGFEKVSAGIIGDRMTNLILNPANIVDTDLPVNEIYFDFRSKMEKKADEFNIYPTRGVMPMYSNIVPYPVYFQKPRIEPDPIISLAFFTKPFPNQLPKLYMGITYQTIYLNEKYYPILQDIYYPVFGYDYNGARVAETDKYPVSDRYYATDNMNNRAHFITGYLGYQLYEDLKIGFKINRSTYDKSGSQGNSNMWNSYYTYDYQSKWYTMEDRSQNYKHWDFSAGIDYMLDEKSNIGLMAGYLPAEATQNLNRMDTSFYSSGRVGTDTNWYYSRSNYNALQNWDKKGNVFYTGISYTTHMQSNQKLFFRYYYQNGDQDITNNSSILDTSYYASRWQWRDTTLHIYNSSSYSKVIDSRTGSGTDKTALHELQALMLWELSDKFAINFGLLYSFEENKIRTSEDVTADRVSNYNSSGYYQPYNYFYRTNEAKELVWEFNWTQRTLQIPVHFKWDVSQYFTLLFGLNRILTDTEIEDVTTAYIHYREQTTDSTTVRQEKFGERYRLPKENTSEVKTSAFLGVNIMPTDKVLLRLLLQPNLFDDNLDSQVWISFHLMP